MAGKRPPFALGTLGEKWLRLIAAFALSAGIVGVAMVGFGGLGDASLESAGEPVDAISQVYALDSVELGDGPDELILASPTPGLVESPGGVISPGPVESPGGVVTPQPVSSPGGVVTPEPAASPDPTPTRSPLPPDPPPAPTGPCAQVPGYAVAVTPDPVQLSPGVYQGSFTIHQCAEGGVGWSAASHPSVSTSAQSGTLEGGATAQISFTVDPDQHATGPFLVRVRITAGGLNTYVEIEGTKTASGGIGDLGTTGGAQ